MAAPLHTRAAQAPARRAAGSTRAPSHRPPAPRPAPPVLRLVAPAPRLRPWRRPRLVITVAAIMVIIVVFGLVTAHVSLAQGQFRLQTLEGLADEAQARYESLRLEVAELEAPGRVVAAAQERLGMVPAPGVTYLSPTGPTTDLADPATPADRDAAVDVDDLALQELISNDRTAGPDATASWLDVKRRLGRRP